MGVITKLCFLLLVVASINSLPIGTKSADADLPNIVTPEVADEIESTTVNSDNKSMARNMHIIRPGMAVESYDVILEPDLNAGVFNGLVYIVVSVSQATREEDLIFSVEGLGISSLQVALMRTTNIDAFSSAPFFFEDGMVFIKPQTPSSMYTVRVEYTGDMGTLEGVYGSNFYATGSYIAMNLHPTNARRVFPCIDEPTETSTISFTVNGLEFSNLISNSRFSNDEQTSFRAMAGPAHLWGLMAHSFNTLHTPAPNVALYSRPGVLFQDQLSAIAINDVFTRLNDWTEKKYFTIVEDVQSETLSIVALPDVSADWHALSIVPVWEPYILMGNSIKQRKEAFVHIAEAIARQWFGYTIFPENWIHEWVITGLGTYAAFDALKNFQSNPNNPDDDSLIDMDVVFLTDVMQESLLLDSFSESLIMEQQERIFEEDAIRSQVHGLIKWKAPAILAQSRYVLGGGDIDFIQVAARNLFLSRSLQPVSSFNFVDSIVGRWSTEGSGLIDDVREYFEPYLHNNGYAVLSVGESPGGLILAQERFGFARTRPSVAYEIPITYTTSMDPNFDDVTPKSIMGAAVIPLPISLGEDDWVLFNIQGRGYYRVNYSPDLWERIIEALEDPERREQIHPSNRATLVDDVLNLARAARVPYDIAFRVVLTMEHETEYVVWKAFVRNMNFVRKRLEALVDEDEDLDPDIYLRMVRRVMGAFENEVGFQPDPNVNEPVMTSLARGLVMSHACQAGYDPCIAAAVDWFYDGGVVNPEIPADIRPAVYCTMVRMGDGDVIKALQERLKIVPNVYERVEILEAMGCSQDDDFIKGYLRETVAVGSPYNLEERSRIFKAVVESSLPNALHALNFLVGFTNEIRQSYGGSAKLEALLFAMVDNMADGDLYDVFLRYVTSTNSNLDDSLESAERAQKMMEENLLWNADLMEEVYEWIDENDATTTTISLFLVCITFLMTMFNH